MGRLKTNTSKGMNQKEGWSNLLAGWVVVFVVETNNFPFPLAVKAAKLGIAGV